MNQMVDAPQKKNMKKFCIRPENSIPRKLMMVKRIISAQAEIRGSMVTLMPKAQMS